MKGRILAVLAASLVALSALTAFQLAPNRHRIEQDLTARSVQALAAGGQRGTGVVFTGRDATVQARTVEDAARARAIVTGVEGVRDVSTRVSAAVEPRRALLGSRADLAAAVRWTATAVPSLQSQLDQFPRVEFGSDAARLTGPAQDSLRQAAELLRNYPDASLRIEGYTDGRGPAAANLELSRRRAEAVRDFLAGAGVDPARLNVRAYGETRPLVADDTPEHRAQNRRVQLVAA